MLEDTIGRLHQCPRKKAGTVEAVRNLGSVESAHDTRQTPGAAVHVSRIEHHHESRQGSDTVDRLAHYGECQIVKALLQAVFPGQAVHTHML